MKWNRSKTGSNNEPHEAETSWEYAAAVSLGTAACVVGSARHGIPERERERFLNQSSTRIHLSDISNKPTSNRFNFHPESLSWNRKGILTATYAMTPKLISVIDDDASVRKTTKLLIESFGYRAVVFESAETFLKSGRLNDTSCLVVDVQMPGMNGLQLQRYLASEGCSIPIIFISAYGNKESRRQAMEASAVAFLDKPFDDKQLLKCIRSALEISES